MRKKLQTMICLFAIFPRLRMLLFILTALSAELAFATQDSAGQPNIILIMADDLGVETIGAYGGESYQTPRINQLAQQGLRFDYAHSQPLCTPSRVKIMTGQYNFRNYQYFMHLDPAQTIFNRPMQAAGYRSLIAGKWQLFGNGMDKAEGMRPEQADFDEYILWQVDRANKGSRYWGPTLDLNGEVHTYPANEFGPDHINNYILDFIERHRDQPFFVYYPMVLPHSPFVTTPDSLEAESREEKFAGMVAYMDTLVGRVVDRVDQLGLGGNTLIIFTGDNGTVRAIHSIRNGERIRGGKAQTTDSGTHVPFVARWPGLIAAGGVSDDLVNFNDIFPTLVELGGGSMPAGHPQDGMSLAGSLHGSGRLPRTEIFIHSEPRWFNAPSARYAFDRRWKLYEGGDFFDYRQDPQEQNPIAPDEMGEEAEQAYRRLAERIATMEGGPVSGGIYLAPVVRYWLFGSLAGFLIVAVGVVWLFRRVRARRRAGAG